MDNPTSFAKNKIQDGGKVDDKAYDINWLEYVEQIWVDKDAVQLEDSDQILLNEWTYAGSH